MFTYSSTYRTVKVLIEVYRLHYDLILACCVERKAYKHRYDLKAKGYAKICSKRLKLDYFGKLIFHPLWVASSSGTLKDSRSDIKIDVGALYLGERLIKPLPAHHSASNTALEVIVKGRSSYSIKATHRLELLMNVTSDTEPAHDPPVRDDVDPLDNESISDGTSGYGTMSSATASSSIHKDEGVAVDPQKYRIIKQMKQWLKAGGEESSMVDTSNPGYIDEAYGNMSVEEVGPDGGTFHICGYGVNFPEKALSQRIDVNLRISVSEHFPVPYIPVAFPIICDLGGRTPGIPINLRIPTWCRPTGSPLNAIICRWREKERSWYRVGGVALPDSGYISISTTGQKIVPFTYKAKIKEITFQICSCLCRSSRGGFTSLHYLSNEALKNALLSGWGGTALTAIDTFPITTTEVKYGDSFPVRMRSVYPELYDFEQGGENFLIIDDEFIKRQYFQTFSFQLNPPVPPMDLIEFFLEVGNNSIKGTYHPQKGDKNERQQSTSWLSPDASSPIPGTEIEKLLLPEILAGPDDSDNDSACSDTSQLSMVTHSERALENILCSTEMQSCVGAEPLEYASNQALDGKKESHPEDASEVTTEEDNGVKQRHLKEGHRIGPDGGKINLEGFTITFPRGALEEEAELNFRTSLDQTPPKGVTFISPVLLCEPDGIHFKKDITIIAPCWCRIANVNNPVPVFIYSKQADQHKWDLTSTESLGQNYKIVFTCDHFSGKGSAVGTDDENQERLIYRLEYLLFGNLGKVFHSVVCSVNETVKKKLISERANLVPIFPGGDQIEVPPHTEIVVGLQSENPDRYPVEPVEFEKFTVSDALMKVDDVSRVFTHSISQCPPNAETLILKLIVHDRRQRVEWPRFQVDPISAHEQPTTRAGGETCHSSASVTINDVMYEVVRKLGDAGWLRFVRTKLHLDEPEIQAINNDHRHDSEEKKFQMVMSWKRKQEAQGIEDENQKQMLLQLKNDFLHSVST